jgi:hypothetical protein
MAVSYIGGRKPEYPEKTTNLSQVTDKLYHTILLSIFALNLEFANSLGVIHALIGIRNGGPKKWQHLRICLL